MPDSITDSEQLEQDIIEALENADTNVEFEAFREATEAFGLTEFHERLQTTLVDTLESMKNNLKREYLDGFIQLHDILLGLQHWHNEIAITVPADRDNPLLAIESSDVGSGYMDLAKTLRDTLVSCSWSLRLLQDRLQSSLSMYVTAN